MVEVVVFAEGPTEEQFIKRLVAPAVRRMQVFVKPQMLKTSQDARGGAILAVGHRLRALRVCRHCRVHLLTSQSEIPTRNKWLLLFAFR